MNIKPFDFIITNVPFKEQHTIVDVIKNFGINCSIQKSIDFWSFSSTLCGSEKELHGDASWFAAPYLDEIKSSTIIHQIISPFVAIPYLEKSLFFKDWDTDYLNSYTNNYCINKYVKYQGRKWNWPELTRDRVELFYVKWNEMIEEKSKNKKYIRFKAELINEETIENLFWIIGAKVTEEQIRKVINSFRVPLLKSSEEKFSTAVTDMAKRYDYL